LAPDLLILGQATVDHVVPARPGPWRPQMGGNALYAAAGARLWLEPFRIGVVTRCGRDYPFALRDVFARAGIEALAVREVAVDHLVEWLIYEEDGARRSLPRNPDLRGAGGEGIGAGGYLARLEALSPTFEDVPAAWRSPAAVYLAPQVEPCHTASLAAFAAAGTVVTIDPSPHYSRAYTPAAMGRLLGGARAFLPSEQEARTWLETAGDARAVARQLRSAGFAEVVIKLGARGALVATDDALVAVPAAAGPVVDPTGAGDAFGGAYAACRLLGHPSVEAARRAAATAARVIATQGTEAALALDPHRA
jgi:sugar/nucleoside kinase (ribokinase family)